MAAHIDKEALRSSLQRLRKAAFEADVVGVMRRTVDAVHGVFGYGGAGIMFITESGRLAYVAASDEAGRQLEEAQASAGRGPCYESYVYAREVMSSDVHADDRWPELRTQLSARVRAVAGTPVLLGGSPVGTLNVYREEPVEWDKSPAVNRHAEPPVRAPGSYSVISRGLLAKWIRRDHAAWKVPETPEGLIVPAGWTSVQVGQDQVFEQDHYQAQRGGDRARGKQLPAAVAPPGQPATHGMPAGRMPRSARRWRPPARWPRRAGPTGAPAAARRTR
jgi:GAF domain